MKEKKASLEMLKTLSNSTQLLWDFYKEFRIIKRRTINFYLNSSFTELSSVGQPLSGANTWVMGFIEFFLELFKLLRTESRSIPSEFWPNYKTKFTKAAQKFFV